MLDAGILELIEFFCNVDGAEIKGLAAIGCVGGGLGLFIVFLQWGMCRSAVCSANLR